MDHVLFRALLGSLLTLCIVRSAAADELIYTKDHPHDFAPKFDSAADWLRRAEFLRRQTLVSQGLWPLPAKCPLDARIFGQIDGEFYTIEKVSFRSQAGHYVTGVLYRPKQAPRESTLSAEASEITKNSAPPPTAQRRPAVLCPYGHWPNGRFIWKSDAEAQKEIASGAEKELNAAKSPLQANCAMLARMGCIVFQYDMVGFGDSTAIEHRQGFLDSEATLRLQSFMGLQTWNSVRALDFVLSLPEVDPKRVAVAGSSSGGTQVIALDAVDPRAAVAFPMVMVSMNMQGGCVCENAPLYRVGTNNVELAALFAPKPQGMAAANDWTRDFLTRGLPEMRSIWRLFGSEQNVWGGHVDFGHNHNLPSREMQYAFLDEQLGLGFPAPVKELPLTPVPPDRLHVWDADHPRPADFCDAGPLRRQMTAASDAQLKALSDAEYIQTVHAALEAMVVDRLPESRQVNVGDDWLLRAGSDRRVPFHRSTPPDWNGAIVIAADELHADQLKQFQAARVAVYTIALSKASVMSPAVASAGKPSSRPATMPATRPDPNPRYTGGYMLGYNRAALAGRVSDLLSAIAAARGTAGVKSIELIAPAGNGPAGLIACALAGAALDRAEIDLGNFDFTAEMADDDPMLLPGALKYGGIAGIIPLCDQGQTRLARVKVLPARPAPHVTISRDASSVFDLLAHP